MMGGEPGERSVGALEARVEEVERECNSHDVANNGYKQGRAFVDGQESQVLAQELCQCV